MPLKLSAVCATYQISSCGMAVKSSREVCRSGEAEI